MLFETIYDIRQAGCRDWFLAPVALALLIVAAVSWRKRATAPPGASPPSSPAFQLFLFGAITFLSFFATWGSYWTLVRQLDKGHAQQLQGVVSDFQPAATYKGTERFTLQGHEFS